MFSYLRPHHRRTPSTPSSPADQTPSFEPPERPVDHGHPQRRQESHLDSPGSLSSPPTLPPITRVMSGGSEKMSASSESSMHKLQENEPRTPVWENSKGNLRSREPASYSNQSRLPYASTQRPDSSGSHGFINYTSSQPMYSPPPTNMENGYKQRSQDPSQNSNQILSSPPSSSGFQNTGRRPTGARLPSPSANVSKFEPVPHKSGKARLNLLNPMSLLARRRTSQAIPQLAPESLKSSRTGQSETLDFRIRGTKVHDFSAPRPRRNVSYNDTRLEESSANARTYQRSPNPDGNGEDSPRWSGGNHTPVFTENFEEEQYPAAGPHVRKANDITDLPLPLPPYAKGAQRPIDLNTAPQSNNVAQNQFPPGRPKSPQNPAPDRPPPIPPMSANRVSAQEKHISIDPSSTPPKQSPSSNKGRPRNVSEVSVKSVKSIKDAIPKHMKSTSSRFSFDMIGAAEQERLLEDRHRARALERQNERTNDDNYGGFEDFDDEYDYDNMDNDDGLEERIPGVNAELDEDEQDLEDLPTQEEDIPEEGFPAEEKDGALGEQANLARFSFQPQWLTPLSPSSPSMVETPRDANGEVIGYAITKTSPYDSAAVAPAAAISPISPASPDLVAAGAAPQGLGLQDLGAQVPAHLKFPKLASQNKTVTQPEFPQPSIIDDDDMYFDDGIIIGLDDEEEIREFDESVFDTIDTDEYGRPLKSLSSMPTLYSPPTLTAALLPSVEKPNSDPESMNKSAETISPSTLPRSRGLAPQPSINPHISSLLAVEQPSQGLTQDTLAAYQSALAAAAFNAAANGKFRRDSTPGVAYPSDPEDIQPGLVADSGQTSHYEPFSPNYELEDDFDYDDALEDDDIIAAANAEALAYDFDGIYGQEFGFYSAPAATAEEYANGGFFGPRGGDGLNRAQSGRIVVREPNLTPITERSEYSNRNSFMSTLMSPSIHGPGSMTSPGLAQLAGLMGSPEYEGGDMSLNGLLKLRRGAWGGSQASQHSSTGSPRSAGGPEDVSPSSYPPWSQNASSGNPSGYNGQGHRRKNSMISVISEGTSGLGVPSQNSSMPGSPTLTMSQSFMAGKKESESENDEKEMERPPFRKHKHSASAESICYLKEEDPVSGERWILERRRTAESGEIELLEREVVQGGRI